jgi:hypothetical protein
MANENTIAQDVAEVSGLLMVFNGNMARMKQDLEEITSHKAYKRVMEMATMLEAFANGQPKPVATKPVGTAPFRKRRTKAEIEAEKAVAANNGAV